MNYIKCKGNEMKSDINIKNEVDEIKRSNLQKLIDSKYSSMNEFSKVSKMDYAAIHRYVSGKMGIGSVVQKRIEKEFGLETGELSSIRCRITEVIKVVKYSMKGKFRSIEDIKSQESINYEYISSVVLLDELKCSKEDVFWLLNENDSMYPYLRKNQSILIDCKETLDIEDGAIYCLIFNSSIYFRKIYRRQEENMLSLTALNQSFETWIVKVEEIEIIGKPRYVQGIM